MPSKLVARVHYDIQLLYRKVGALGASSYVPECGEGHVVISTFLLIKAMLSALPCLE